MTPELESISQLPGVLGVCFHHEGEVLFQNFPATFGHATAQTLSQSVSKAISAYRNADRNVDQAFFLFPQCAVLILASPKGNGQYLSVLVQDQASVPHMLPAARAFLARQSSSR